jgi:NADH dehydrogenase
MHVVTGAFGYSGQYIARRLLEANVRVRTLTNSIDRANAFAGAIEVRPYSFDDADALARSLDGATVLYNTYWVRFDHRGFNHDEAVRNTRALLAAARRAGVRRLVHVSITNPSEDSDLPYFRGKAVLERAVRDSGISYAILRPTVLFGREDILINNIAWVLRRFPVFGVFGDGRYTLQPIFVDDLAALAVAQGVGHDDVTIDAIGPETFTYRELVETIARAIGVRRPIVAVPPALGLIVGRVIGALVGDVVITREEIRGLMENRLSTTSPPAGPTRLTNWLTEHAEEVGRRYSSELARRRDRTASYEALRGTSRR